LLFILLLAVAIDRLAMAHSDRPEKESEKVTALTSTSSIVPSQLLLSSCKDVGDAGQISR
jgi:hypothetical protein